MFAEACKEIKESVYGLLGWTRGGTTSLGTAFAIAPGVLATVAHLTYKHAGVAESCQENLEVLRATEIGSAREKAALIAIDPIRDLALLRIERPRSNAHVKLIEGVVLVGTEAGSIGFPMSDVNDRTLQFNPILRFQGGYISSFHSSPHESGQTLPYYETDTLMYPGSSGCPGFLKDASVFGMHVASMHEWITSNTSTKMGDRAAISFWVPSTDIRSFARSRGVRV